MSYLRWEKGPDHKHVMNCNPVQPPLADYLYGVLNIPRPETSKASAPVLTMAPLVEGVSNPLPAPSPAPVPLDVEMPASGEGGLDATREATHGSQDSSMERAQTLSPAAETPVAEKMVRVTMPDGTRKWVVKS